MKRDAFIRDLRRYARTRDLAFSVAVGSGKGSHYRVRLGEAVSTVQSGELGPLHVARICRQLRIDAGDL